MSVYSGFATRLQETSYDQLTHSLIQLLSLRVLSLYRSDPIDEISWIRDFGQVYRRLIRLEQHKYQPPKLTSACKDIAEVLGTDSTVSSHTSSKHTFRRGGKIVWIKDVSEAVLEELGEERSVRKGDWTSRGTKTPQPEKTKTNSSPYLRKFSKERKLKTLRPHFQVSGPTRPRPKPPRDSSLMSQ